jgi:molybdate transport system substrate-binding protein
MVALCAAGLIWRNLDSRRTSKPSIQVWCAASLKGPLDELAASFENASGAQVTLQYGGSGTLWTAISTSKLGDLFIPADSTYLKIAEEKGIAGECFALATMRPVLAVAHGNPQQVHGWADLLNRQDLKLGLCHPELAAIGMTVKSIAQRHGDWPSLQTSADVMKGSVSELALDLKTGSLDAAFVWDQTVASMSELAVIPCDELAGNPATVSAMVLPFSKSKETALQFARWIASPEHGKPVFKRHHFVTD